MYYLIDLERSIGSGQVHYWKRNRYGYTSDLKEAGEFNESIAQEIVANDFDKRTVMIAKEEVERIMN